MAFPEIVIEKIPRKFLWWAWNEEIEKTVGWERIGERKQQHFSDGSAGWESCPLCMTHIWVGREDGVPFKYCPECLIKCE